MAREKGDLISCMGLSIHHLSEANLGLIRFLAIADQANQYEYRMKLVRNELETALAQVEKIKKIAEKKDFQDVLVILNEEVEFGHDFD